MREKEKKMIEFQQNGGFGVILVAPGAAALRRIWYPGFLINIIDVTQFGFWKYWDPEGLCAHLESWISLGLE